MGHVVQMDENELPKKTLYGQTQEVNEGVAEQYQDGLMG